MVSKRSGGGTDPKPPSGGSTFAKSNPKPRPLPSEIPPIGPAGTPIKIAIDRELRIHALGQPVHGRVTEPIYTFDKLAVPVGSQVTGKVSALDPGTYVAVSTKAAFARRVGDSSFF